MDSQLKQRLVGAVTLLVLGIIFIPMVLDGSPTGREGGTAASRADDRNAGWRASPAPAHVVVEPERPPVVGPLPGLDRPPSQTAPAPVPPTGRSQAPPPAAAPTVTARVEKPTVTPLPKVEGMPDGDDDAAPVQPATARADTAPAAQPDSAASPAADAPTDQSTWSLQVASFREHERAAMIRSRLEGAGYPAFIRNANLGGRIWHQVLVGPGLSRARAEALREEIYTSFKAKRLVLEPGMLVRNP